MINIDIETRSPVDLAKAGVHVYAQHPLTRLFNFSYSIDDGPEMLWEPGNPVPVALELALLEGQEVHAWNAQFERVMWPVVQRSCPLPDIALEQWRCTMVRAFLMGFPGGLAKAATSMGLTEAKDTSGHRLMLLVSKPRNTFKPGAKGYEEALALLGGGLLPEYDLDSDGTIYQWWVDASRCARMGDYVKRDVAAERAASKFLDPIPDRELAGWQLDQRINDRGFNVDLELAEAARRLMGPATKAADKELARLTGGALTKVTKPNDLRAWLNERLGLELASINKEALVVLRSEHDLDDLSNAVIDLRLSAAKTSTAKINSITKGVSADGRFRGGLQYAGAGRTNRYAGRRFQPHNIPRPPKWAPDAVPYVLTGRVEPIELLFGPALEAISGILRSCIVPSGEGSSLLVADYNAIEARVVAWLAGAGKLLGAFARGDDPYRMMAATVFGIPDWRDIAKTDDKRALGKAIVLGCGFQMGANRFWESCRKDGLNVDKELAQKSVTAYREDNPEVPKLWANIQDAAIFATENQHEWVSMDDSGRIWFYHDNRFLRMRLPSGRLLSYQTARTYESTTPWGSPCTKLQFWGWNGQANRMEWQSLYGGRLTENAVQAIARDVLLDAMLALDTKGWHIILSVHDEILTDERTDAHSVTELEEIMAETPSWAPGLPLNVEGWQGDRYRK